MISPTRSPELMSAGDTALVIVDVQEKLIGLIPGHTRLVWNLERLLQAATILGVAREATEQYPRGLGSTIANLKSHFAEIPEKLAFSGMACADLFAKMRERGIFRILLAGIETHVCVQQTALDLLAAGFRVYVAVDAVGSRFAIDHETALRRMETSGVVLTTTEAAVFEWCEVAGTPQFKALSALIKQAPPA